MRVNHHRHHATNPSLDLRYTNNTSRENTTNRLAAASASNNNNNNGSSLVASTTTTTTNAAAAAMSAAQMSSAAHLNVNSTAGNVHTASSSGYEQSSVENDVLPSRILVLSRARGSKRSSKDARIETISENTSSNLGKYFFKLKSLFGVLGLETFLGRRTVVF